MSHFVLVHGACHQAAHWKPVVERLERAGHRAIAVNLPGHPDSDGTATLDDAIAATFIAIEAAGDPVILVGHSLGGMTIAGAAERVPDRIARVDFLAAVIPADGESAAMLGTGEGFGAHTVSVMDDLGRVSIPDEAAASLFFEDHMPAGMAPLCATDPGYLTTPVRLSPEGFGRVPKRYILCLRDRAIAPPAQIAQIGKWPDIERVDLDTGHGPLLIAPDRLVAILTT